MPTLLKPYFISSLTLVYAETADAAVEHVAREQQTRPAARPPFVPAAGIPEYGTPVTRYAVGGGVAGAQRVDPTSPLSTMLGVLVDDTGAIVVPMTEAGVASAVASAKRRAGLDEVFVVHCTPEVERLIQEHETANGELPVFAKEDRGA